MLGDLPLLSQVGNTQSRNALSVQSELEGPFSILSLLMVLLLAKPTWHVHTDVYVKSDSLINFANMCT